MKLKSFIAGPEQAALGMAREELGAEAILVNSRKSPPEAKRLGEYRAVSASVPGDATPAACFARRPEIDTHLVLQATAKSADLTSVEVRFEIFRPSKLLFTRVDEASSFGPAFSEAVRTAKPVSFLTTGQQALEDFEEAAKARVIELILQPNSDYGAFAAGNDYGR